MKNRNKLSKFLQRKEALLKRKKIFNENKKAHENLFDTLYSSDILDSPNIIASYFSVNSEIQTENLNNKIIILKKNLCLRIVESKNKSLLFRIFNKETKMIKGKFQIMEPEKKSINVSPDLLLVPCVAFDILGYRMGYGGGYYDRTIKKLRLIKKNLKLIIVAFKEQEVKNIIVDENDEKLDYILTEEKLIKVNNK